MTFTGKLAAVDQSTLIVSDWISYTPIFTAQGGGATVGDGTIEGKWRRIGDSMEISIKLTWGSTTSAGSSENRWSIPNGYTIDQTKLPSTSRGTVYFTDDSASAAGRRVGTVILRPDDVGEEIATNAAGGFSTNATNPHTWAVSDTLQLEVTLPIVGFGDLESPQATTPLGRGLFTNRYSPLAVYHLDGNNNLVDQSGNEKTLTEDSAPVERAGYLPGISAINGGRYSRTDSDFLIQTAVSVVALVRVTTASGGPIQTIAAYGNSGETSGANTQWLLGISDQTVAYSVYYLAENGSGTNSQLVGADLLPLGEWVVLGFTRNSAATSVTLYVNGHPTDSGSVTAPDGGGSSALILQEFQDSSSGNPQDVQAVALYDQELTAEQMLIIAQDVLGTREGVVFQPSVTPSTLTGDVDDYNPSGFSSTEFLRVDGGAANRTITGLQAPNFSRRVTLINVGTTNNITLADQDGGSASSNQFLITGGALTLPPNGVATLWYDSVSSKWRVV